MFSVEMYNLNMRKKYVCARINAEQNVLYRRFQRKIQSSQMQHARSTGDKEIIKKLRAEQKERNAHLSSSSYKESLERRASVMIVTG